MPTKTGVNEAGIRAVVTFLAFFPERWDQTVVHGRHRGMTTYCFATLTCWLAGEDIDDLIEADRAAGNPLGDRIYRRAAELLGLSDGQAARIFRYGVTDAGEHPTLKEFCRRIASVTGVVVDPGRIS